MPASPTIWMKVSLRRNTYSLPLFFVMSYQWQLLRSQHAFLPTFFFTLTLFTLLFSTQLYTGSNLELHTKPGQSKWNSIHETTFKRDDDEYVCNAVGTSSNVAYQSRLTARYRTNHVPMALAGDYLFSEYLNHMKEC